MKPMGEFILTRRQKRKLVQCSDPFEGYKNSPSVFYEPNYIYYKSIEWITAEYLLRHVVKNIFRTSNKLLTNENC